MNRCERCQTPTESDHLVWWEHPPSDPWWLMEEDTTFEGISVCPDCNDLYEEQLREREDQ